ncbi:DUF305 domain-containing protein [Segeticoccus rhizosphaerae]|uniref:DUF305 domain-containing protein n=1 Tax=Segeticoccus rhizosphaerae TaxID=1104777 RepID=UPI0010C1447F|nr:DUF305 domain-containing protein [Ornithinicoccus soli]
MVAATVSVAVLAVGGGAYAAPRIASALSGQLAAERPGGQQTGDMMAQFSGRAPFDAQFLDQMIMHHQGAIVSTQAMIADSDRPQLRRLARDIITTQRDQIQKMRAWRASWYPHLGSTFTMMGGSMMDGADTDGGSMMSGPMMSGAMMSGPGVDRMYLQMMIAHHQVAVEMAGQAQHRGEHPKLRDLAMTIDKEQSAQIKQMRSYLKSLPPVSAQP